MDGKEDYKQLTLRARRLVELLEMSAPEQLIAREIVLIFKAGISVMPALVSPSTLDEQEHDN